MISPGRDYPLIRGRLDSEPYSPEIVEDLISGLNDWRNVQDIVRLTFKALSDVVKSQGTTVKELELQIPSKASKADIAQCMALRSSYTETVRSLAEIKSLLESRASIDDVYSITDEKASKSEMQYMIAGKVSYEEMREMLSEKAEVHELQAEIRAMKNTIEGINEEIHRKLQMCATNRDLQHLQSIIETKASISEVNEVMEEKANKQSVANALHRKANKIDVESMLEDKVDVSEFNRIIESLEIMNREIQNKAEKSELDMCSTEVTCKVERNEFETVVDSLQTLRKESENKVFTHLSHLEGFVSAIKSDLEDFQSSMVSSLARKSEIRDLEELESSIASNLSRKGDKRDMEDFHSSMTSAFTRSLEELQSTITSSLSKKTDIRDFEEFHTSITSALSKKSDTREVEKLTQSISYKSETEVSTFSNRIKQDICEINESIRYDFHKYQEFCNERALKSEQCCKNLQDEISRIHENIRIVSDRSRESIEESVKSLQAYSSSRFDEVKLFKVQLDQHQKEIDDLFQKKLERIEFKKAIDAKADLKDLQDLNERHDRDLSRQLQHQNDEFKSQLLRKERELTLIIDSKPGVHEITSLILENNLIKLKRSNGEDNFYEEKSLKNSTSDYDNQVKSHHRGNSLENLQLDLMSFRKEFDSKLSNYVLEQRQLREMMCNENYIARWVWRSGNLGSAFAIPWEVESLNTCPENFQWENGSCSIIIATAGFYEIDFAVFSRKRPSVELLVNGEAVLIEFSNQGKTWGRHSDGNIIGACAVEFLSLPKRARVSMTYSGESGAEGFLSLKKL